MVAAVHLAEALKSPCSRFGHAERVSGKDIQSYQAAVVATARLLWKQRGCSIYALYERVFGGSSSSDEDDDDNDKEGARQIAAAIVVYVQRRGKREQTTSEASSQMTIFGDLVVNAATRVDRLLKDGVDAAYHFAATEEDVTRRSERFAALADRVYAFCDDGEYMRAVFAKTGTKANTMGGEEPVGLELHEAMADTDPPTHNDPSSPVWRVFTAQRDLMGGLLLGGKRGGPGTTKELVVCLNPRGGGGSVDPSARLGLSDLLDDRGDHVCTFLNLCDIYDGVLPTQNSRSRNKDTVGRVVLALARSDVVVVTTTTGGALWLPDERRQSQRHVTSIAEEEAFAGSGVSVRETTVMLQSDDDNSSNNNDADAHICAAAEEEQKQKAVASAERYAQARGGAIDEVAASAVVRTRAQTYRRSVSRPPLPLRAAYVRWAGVLNFHITLHHFGVGGCGIPVPVSAATLESVLLPTSILCFSLALPGVASFYLPVDDARWPARTHSTISTNGFPPQYVHALAMLVSGAPPGDVPEDVALPAVVQILCNAVDCGLAPWGKTLRDVVTFVRAARDELKASFPGREQGPLSPGGGGSGGGGGAVVHVPPWKGEEEGRRMDDVREEVKRRVVAAEGLCAADDAMRCPRVSAAVISRARDAQKRELTHDAPLRALAEAEASPAARRVSDMARRIMGAPESYATRVARFHLTPVLNVF